MTKTLHILNGDGLAYNFKKCAIEGDLCIWRELMCEGPLSANPLDDLFWSGRAAYFTENYEETVEGYAQKVISQLDKFSNLKEYTEIILWFEHDLVCQINLMFILNLLHLKRAKKGQVKLICIDQHPEVEDFRGLGQLSPAQLEKLLQTRVDLEESDLEYTAKFWRSYYALPTEMFSKLMLQIPRNLGLAFHAVINTLRLYPSVSNGFNYVEQKLISILSAESMTSKQLIGKWISLDLEYGYGDAQLEIILSSLMPQMIVENEGMLSLSETAHQILNGQSDYYDHRENDKILRGRFRPKDTYRFDDS